MRKPTSAKQPEIVPDRVVALREALGLTQADLADRLGMTQQGVDAIENGKSRRPTKIVLLARVLRTTPDYLYGQSVGEPYYVPNPDDEPAPEFDDGESQGTAAALDGRVMFSGKLPGSTAEFKSAPGAGQGQILDSGNAQIKSNGVLTGHPVAAEWVLPHEYVRHGLDAAPTGIIILPVVGHSMEPMLSSGDRVIVDISQSEWVSEAIYAIDDGDTRFQVKTVRKLLGTFPARFRIISEADKSEEVYLGQDQFRIVGRVVGRISRM